ncbi:Uncharacterised protein [Mycobacterium tuberculosis]|uniref:Uncharacterized protein n=1 Tax=Mycobacterium tuberculosis TaxID=1773 RepID=A0A916PFX0_MYCTX|nr:Uncharacterised protein [Mycobacterium tuberculosis]CPA34605.1 Uncharacterised protein [Mycobacterium tuberculosis]CPB18440.1 Uncharacterised protein [Mycobacterium tuberculosis]
MQNTTVRPWARLRCAISCSNTRASVVTGIGTSWTW